jgi:hypothetical protein
MKLCPECAAFGQDVDRQRRRLALVLPVLPTLGLKERVLEAASAASAGGGAAGGAAAGGGLGSLGTTAMKIGAAVLVLGGGVATFGDHSGDGGLSRDGEVDGASSPLTLARETRRRRAGASATATEPDQPGEEAGAAPQSPDAAPSSSQPAPEAPQTPAPQTPAPQTEAPTQQRDALPDVEVEAEIGVEVEVEPPAPVP